MTGRDVLELARQAGLTDEVLVPWAFEIDRLAALVAAAARAEEREACAKHAEDFLTKGRSPLGRAVAAAIRARGETK